MAVLIRRAGVADAELLSSLNVDVQTIHWLALPTRFKPPGPETFPPSAAAELLAKPNNLVFVAEIDSEPVGYAYAEVIHRPETPFSYSDDLVYLHHISLRPSCRKQGLGHALINAVRSAADGRGITHLALDVWTFNEKARSFFRRQGFTPYIERLWSR
jgi:GNAT superfamily N-acetyltransferase